MAQARDVNEWLRLTRSGKKHTIEDVLHKIWLCKANDHTGVLYLPRCVRNTIITINECNLKGELIDGPVMTATIGKKTIVGIGLKALGKRFKIISVQESQSLPYDHRQLKGQLNTQEVPKDGRAAEEPSPDREGL